MFDDERTGSLVLHDIICPDLLRKVNKVRRVSKLEVFSSKFCVSGARNVRFLLVTLLLGLLVGCSSGDAQVESELLSAEQRLDELQQALNAGTLRNAAIIRQYSQILRNDRPELSSLLSVLEREATLENPLYASLRQRFNGIKNGTENFESWTEKVEELQSIQTASNTAVFNDALSDTVNVIADLSDGSLARVNAVSKEADMALNNSKDQGPGSQYVGNPHYGRWSHGSGGSLWAWYGQYAFFSNLMGGRNYYYNSWAGGRGYSYYHDMGRNNYSSRSQKSGMRDAEQRSRKQFGSSGKFKSPYAKTRSGASGVSRASTAQSKSLFKSPYAKSGTGSKSASKFQSSTRSSGFRTTRGASRGK